MVLSTTDKFNAIVVLELIFFISSKTRIFKYNRNIIITKTFIKVVFIVNFNYYIISIIVFIFSTYLLIY